MVLNIGAKFEGKLMCAFKNVIRNFANFYHSMFEKSKNWNFDGILLSKVENIKENYVSRQWRMMQNLKRNWLVSSKLIWIWWILTQALRYLKNLYFNGLLLTKIYVWAKKVQRSYVWFYWILMQNLKENWRVLSKMNEEFCKFSPEQTWNSKNWDFDGILLSTVENVWA